VQAKAVPFVLAPISVETGNQAVKALVAAAKSFQTADAKARRDYLSNTVAAARLIGTPLTSAQFDKQLAKAVRDALTGKVTDVTSAASKAKAVCLAVNSGDASLLPVMGETMNAFLERVRVPLESAKLPDGTPIHAKAADGTVTGKRGAKAGKTKGPSKGSEGNQSQSAEMRAALILMGSEALAAKLVVIAGSFRDDFMTWSTALIDADVKAKATSKAIFKAVDNANVQ
jgi:hypothetical protein